MKIILAVDSIHRPLTGIGRYAWKLCQGLQKSTQISSIEYVAHGRWVDDPLVLLDPIQGPTVGGARKMLAGSRIATAAYGTLMPIIMRWQLRQRPGGLFHSPNFFLPPYHGKSVSTFHDLSIYDHPEFHPKARVDFMRREIPKALRRANMLIAVSEFTRQQVIERFDWPPERIVTVLQGVDADFEHQHPPKQQALIQKLGLQADAYTLCVSTIEPRKNLDRLIAAYRRLPPQLRKEFPLVIVGERGWRSEQTHAAMAQAEEDGWLRYHGYLSEEQLRAVLGQCAIFIFASVYEGFGLPVLEAMKSGRPVVSADLPPIREFAKDAIRYFDPYDADAIEGAIKLALEDQLWRQRAGIKARQQAELLSWENTVDKTINVYRKTFDLSDD